MASWTDDSRLACRLKRRRVQQAMGLADQALWNGTNLLFNILALRTLGLEGFGWLSVAFIITLVTSGLINSYYTESAIASQGEAVVDSRQNMLRNLRLVGAFAAAGPLASLTLYGVTDLPVSALAVAAVLPLFAMQDNLRQSLIAGRRAHVALIGETFWVAVQGTAIVFLPTTYWITAFWPFAAGMLIAFSISFLRTLTLAADSPEDKQVQVMGSFQRDLAVEHLLTAGTGQLTVLFLGWGGGVGQLGLARAAFLAFGPLNTLVAGSRIVFVPDAAKLAHHNPQALAKIAKRFVLFVGLIVLIWTTLVAAPGPLATLLFGSAADDIRDLVPYAGYARFGNMAMFVPLIALRGLRRSDLSKRATVFSALLLVATSAVAGITAPPLVFLLALGTANLLALMLWWRMLRRAIRTATAGTAHTDFS